MLVDQALNLFLGFQRAQNRSEHTVLAYHTDLFQFFSFAAAEIGMEWESLTIESIDLFVVRSYMGLLAEHGLARKSVARKLAALRTFFKFMCREGVISQNPVQKIASPKLGHRLPSFSTWSKWRHSYTLSSARLCWGRGTRLCWNFCTGQGCVLASW